MDLDTAKRIVSLRRQLIKAREGLEILKDDLKRELNSRCGVNILRYSGIGIEDEMQRYFGEKKRTAVQTFREQIASQQKEIYRIGDEFRELSQHGLLYMAAQKLLEEARI